MFAKLVYAVSFDFLKGILILAFIKDPLVLYVKLHNSQMKTENLFVV